MRSSLLPSSPPAVSLPQKDDEKRRRHRAYELSLARTRYNYTTSYLYPAPLAAQVPDADKFSLAYQAKVAPVLLEVAENMKAVLVARFEAQLRADLPAMPMPWMVALQKAIDAAKEQFSGLNPLNVPGDLAAIVRIFEALHDAPPEVADSYQKLARIPGVVEGLGKAIAKSLDDMKDVGITSFLRDTLYETLRTPASGDAYLHAKDLAEFKTLYPGFPEPPAVMNLAPRPWMRLAPGQEVWESDWYFGWLQIAGFNTSNLKGVFPAGAAPEMALDLGALIAKMPATDAMLRAASGDSSVTLARAAELGRLYALDLTMLEGVPTSKLHGDQRYLTAPIALFYWNPEPGAGYPEGRGSLQPVAIQLGQKHDPATCPIFLPGGDAAAWKLAKFYVLNGLAVQHETVAHLGACHLTVETFVVATNRQLSFEHPILALLAPHFRFTLDINEGAKHSLIIPHGVVASVLSPSIAGSLGMVRDARLAWRFDQNLPHRLFALRGVDRDRLPEFPFRDDTLLLWDAIRGYVRAYLACYYAGNDDVAADTEVQAWVQEVTSPAAAGFRGLGGLKWTGGAEGQGTPRLDSLDALVDMVSLLVYTAGPQHANVNYAQYPMMSYLPSVSGSLYAPPPRDAASAAAPGAYLAALPPVDVALYQLSFGYLLSSVQYDTFGTYSDNPRRPYFADPKAEAVNVDFRLALAAIEAQIRTRNRTRPLPYESQLPSMIPNSISI
ncbi:MAG TPA: lipoxygenase family protein [Thermoanaerobaculia bacterium]|nr:lipoxygenase family protein [Thermoanaerobaculia bacterium]HQR66013.1 lipoxygenase family protein [Thermoanaerobaculia bacterium]